MSAPLRDFSRSLPMALLRAREAVMARFRPLLRRHGVTEQQWRVLRALESGAEASASAIAETTCIGLPSLSRILASLGARGLVTRRVKATDLRTTLVSLAPARARLLRKAGVESEARYQPLSAEIGEADLKRLYALLAAAAGEVAGARALVGNLAVVLEPGGVGPEDKAVLRVAIRVQDDLYAVGVLQRRVAPAVRHDDSDAGAPSLGMICQKPSASGIASQMGSPSTVPSPCVTSTRTPLVRAWGPGTSRTTERRSPACFGRDPKVTKCRRAARRRISGQSVRS